MGLSVKAMVFVVALAPVTAGAGVASVSAEVFYRSFDSTSIVNLDSAALASAYDQHKVIQDADQLHALAKALDLPCVPVPSSQVQDLRLVVRWSGNQSWTWEASQFAYKDSRTNKVCALPRAQRQNILAVLHWQR